MAYNMFEGTTVSFKLNISTSHYSRFVKHTNIMWFLTYFMYMSQNVSLTQGQAEAWPNSTK